MITAALIAAFVLILVLAICLAVKGSDLACEIRVARCEIRNLDKQAHERYWQQRDERDALMRYLNVDLEKCETPQLRVVPRPVKGQP